MNQSRFQRKFQWGYTETVGKPCFIVFKGTLFVVGSERKRPDYLFVILYDKSFYFFDSHYLCTFFLLVFLRICSSSSMVEYFGSEKSFFISEV